MSEYLSKKAVLEWLKKQRKEMESECEIDREGAYLDVIEEIQSGVFDAPEMEHINTYWAREGLIKHQKAEIQRLRAALTAMRQAVWDELVPIKLVTKINKIADEALSTTTEPTDAAKVERVKINYCMECDSNTSNNDFCSVCGSKHIIPGINASEKEGQTE